MTTRRVFVHFDDGGFSGAVGQLWLRSRQRRESASFRYDEDWLRHPGRFAPEPALDLQSGAFHTEPEQRIFGVFSDAAPDRWGRKLLQREETRRAAEAGETPRAADGGRFPAPERRRNAAGGGAFPRGVGVWVSGATPPVTDSAARGVTAVARRCPPGGFGVR